MKGGLGGGRREIVWRGEPERGREELFKEKTMKKTNDRGSAV